MTLISKYKIHIKPKRRKRYPLEFKVALIFAVLFVIFTVLTHYTLVYAGTGGLNLLSFVSGFSDITPFILNLLQNTGSAPKIRVTTLYV